MKLFQQLLVAPAALGLLAPLAANAAEVNIDSVVDYVSPIEQESSAQFSDVVPGDWTYSALKNLSESYGCVDNAYTQTLKNGQALTRYEAASLINACLDNGLSASSEGISPEASRLVNEFASEMAILKGRVDGLEYRANEFQAGQFASTTQLSGAASFVIGAEGGDGAKGYEALRATYSYKVDLNTSFTGEDNLYAGIETGNLNTSTDWIVLDSGVDPTTNNALELTSLYYSFPVGDFTVAAGPLFDQDDLVPTTTSTYSNSFMLAGWNLGPNAIALQGFTGAGAGVAYTSDSGFNAGFNVVSIDGADSAKGIGTDEGNDVVTFMAGYDGDSFGGGIIYGEMDNPNAAISTVTDYSAPTTFEDKPNVLGLGAYWQITENLDLSAGLDIIDLGKTGYEEGSQLAIGLDYAVGAGTLSLGMGTIPYWNSSNDYDSAGTAYEIYYDYPVADGINIKPGIFMTDLDEAHEAKESTAIAVEATFSF